MKKDDGLDTAKRRALAAIEELGKVSGEIAKELNFVKAQVYTDPKDISNLIEKRAILESQQIVVNKSLQEAQYFIKHIAEETQKDLRDKEIRRKTAIFDAVKSREKLPLCPRCGKSDRVGWSGNPCDAPRQGEFWSDPNEKNWAVPMECNRPECSIRFWYFPEKKSPKTEEDDEIIEEEDDEEE